MSGNAGARGACQTGTNESRSCKTKVSASVQSGGCFLSTWAYSSKRKMAAALTGSWLGWPTLRNLVYLRVTPAEKRNNIFDPLSSSCLNEQKRFLLGRTPQRAKGEKRCLKIISTWKRRGKRTRQEEIKYGRRAVVAFLSLRQVQHNTVIYSFPLRPSTCNAKRGGKGGVESDRKKRRNIYIDETQINIKTRRKRSVFPTEQQVAEINPKAIWKGGKKEEQDTFSELEKQKALGRFLIPSMAATPIWV